MKKSYMSYRNFIILTAIIALIDQVQKFYTVQYFASNPAFKVTSYFNMVMVWNYGVSFGMFQSPVYGKYVFAIIALIISYVLIRMWRAERNKFMGIGIACIIGGAIGNVIDRFHYGAVADFFDFHIGSYHWPAFNIADVTIFIGAIMLLVDGFRNEKNN